MALDDVMGSAALRDERDTAEPAGTRNVPNTLCTAQLRAQRKQRIQPLSPGPGATSVAALQRRAGRQRGPCLTKECVALQAGGADYLLQVNFLHRPAGLGAQPRL
jgi:hypothetical protein